MSAAACLAGVLAVGAGAPVLPAWVQDSPQVIFASPTGLVVPCPFSAPCQAGNSVLVAINKYGGGVVADVVSVVVDGVAASKVLEAENLAAWGTETELWLASGVSGLTGDVHVSLVGVDAYGTICAQEFSGLGAVEFVRNGAPFEPAISYPALSALGCLAVTIACDADSSGPGHWVAPAGYALSLDVATWTASSSGASAWQVLASAAASIVGWPVPAVASSGSQALIIFAPEVP